MLYRKFGKTNENVSILAFGCMRLPVINNYTKQIDDEKAIKMVRHAIDEGLNYIDTAYPYHGGMSEAFVGRTLKDGYRDKVKIATKLPCWLIKTRQDMDKYLNEQLERLETNYIDFYLLHSLNKGSWEKMKELGALEFLDQALEDGRIKHAGFSFHDKGEVFKEIVDGYDWSFCQIQYNYIDEYNQAGKEGLEYAASKGLGIAIMEPLRGGNLVKSIPNEVISIFDLAKTKRTPVEWALRWLYDNKYIHVVLSGMSEMVHVEENIKIAKEAYSNSLTEAENDIINKAKKAFQDRIKINCTGCEYCLPCPAGVNIPQNFTLFNEYNLFDGQNHKNASRFEYNNMDGEQKASFCIKCGKCETHCPQNISIREMLEEVDNTLKEQQ